jgi:hypothetical protein
MSGPDPRVDALLDAGREMGDAALARLHRPRSWWRIGSRSHYQDIGHAEGLNEAQAIVNRRALALLDDSKNGS